MYNLFVHNLAQILYQDLQYDDKQNNTILLLMIFGVAGIIIAEMLKRNKKYKNKYVSTGLKYGGIALILTVLVASWNDMGNELKLLGFGILFGLLIWYCYKK